MKAIGLNHRFASAIAHLLHNSVDAHASRVLIRFVARRGLTHRLLVIDNGRGMNESEISTPLEIAEGYDRICASYVTDETCYLVSWQA
jgi:Histidine kinase-, DNA gyrase B-, and HSP90-like ATPase